MPESLHQLFFLIFSFLFCSLELKRILDSQPFLVFIAEIQCRTIFHHVSFCGCASLIAALYLWPLDADLWIVPCHAAFITWMIEVCTLVAEFCHIG